MNSSSSCRQVGEGLFIHNSQKLAVTAQMSGTSGHRAELPDLTAATHLKVLQKYFGVRAKLLEPLIGYKRLT